ncbi:MAG: bifunctional tetrahydrofolate synthase/dihydrofolate synthase [Gammaproteobacteria bacterium]|nr:MAG: bifunctional tetrahydrofolate synthase/dihydrofolate synthase [Gammaproteobacteria bacterium]PCI60715.1 MAG: bifunctional tetrahydrofolate synthase/dihydrofolate synthase [Gammaproteobacteria bacterium]
MTPYHKSHEQVKNLSQWLFYLENLHSKEIDLGLTRISKVAQRLAVDLSFAQVITVAGTNGKGTSCAFLENYLRSENSSVAVYSSPHIECFNERLRINHQDIDDQSLIVAFEQIEHARSDISLSYYEFTTLAAFLVLMVQKPQFIILEVGLGGRLDATNIIDADIMLITAIGIDHTNFLGTDRESIGFEKAGIMRSNKTVIIADLTPPNSVLAHANTIAAHSVVRNKDFIVDIQGSTWSWHYSAQQQSKKEQKQKQALEYKISELLLPFIPLDNVASALAVLAILGASLTVQKINNCIEKTKVAGRMEFFLYDNQAVILDVAHNPQAAEYLADQLKLKLKAKGYKKITAVVAMMADKDINGALAPLVDIIDTWYLGKLAIERAASPELLASTLSQLNQSYNCFDNVTDAFKMACQQTNKNELIIVFGSFFTVAAIRPLLLN